MFFLVASFLLFCSFASLKSLHELIDILPKSKPMIRLRPHHLIDIIRNIGHERPVEPHPFGHAQHLITGMLLDGNNHEIMLVAEADDLCAPCEHLNDSGQCRHNLPQLEVNVSKQKYNDALDGRLFRFFELEPGSVISLRRFLVMIQSRFEEVVPLCLHPEEDFDYRRDGLRKGLVKLKTLSYR